MPNLWTENESIDEIKHRLLCTTFELASVRMEANKQIKKYEETIKRLFQLLQRVCQERDEARDQIQLLLEKLQPSAPTMTTPHPHIKTTKELQGSSKIFPTRSFDLSLASCQSRDHTRITESSSFTRTTKEDLGPSRDIMVDRASIMSDKLDWGKPLPQKGRLLRTVTEAGPLLNTLLVAPLPQWKNPPPLSSPCIPSSLAYIDKVDDKASVDNPNGLIPTSLSLAFPGDSREPSKMSSASGLGLSVNNEQVPRVDVDSDYHMMSNKTLTGKKRRLL